MRIIVTQFSQIIHLRTQIKISKVSDNKFIISLSELHDTDYV